MRRSVSPDWRSTTNGAGLSRVLAARSMKAASGSWGAAIQDSSTKPTAHSD